MKAASAPEPDRLGMPCRKKRSSSCRSSAEASSWATRTALCRNRLIRLAATKARAEPHTPLSHAGSTFVIPVLLRPVHIAGMEVEDLQSIPAPGHPVTDPIWGSQDAAWESVVASLSLLVGGAKGAIDRLLDDLFEFRRHLRIHTPEMPDRDAKSIQR